MEYLFVLMRSKSSTGHHLASSERREHVGAALSIDWGPTRATRLGDETRRNRMDIQLGKAHYQGVVV